MTGPVRDPAQGGATQQPGEPPVAADGSPGPMVAPPSMEQTEADVKRSLQVANAGLQPSSDPREAKEWAAAVLSLAQALVIMDPQLVAPQGVPIDAIHPPAPRSGAAKIPTDKSHSAQSS